MNNDNICNMCLKKSMEKMEVVFKKQHEVKITRNKQTNKNNIWNSKLHVRQIYVYIQWFYSVRV